MKLGRRSLLFSVLVALAACGSGSGGGGSGAGTGAGTGTGTLAVHVTDKPIDPALVEHAILEATAVRAHVVGHGIDEFVTLYEGPALVFDLRELTNGVTQMLAQAHVPAGLYDQIRLVLSGGELELVNGNLYTTEAGNLELTSTDQAGLKIFLDPPVNVPEGGTHDVLLDFDLSKTFKPVPGSDPLSASKFLVHPVVHGTSVVAMGTIAGTVTEPDGAGGAVGSAEATVHVFQPGVTDPALAVSTAITNPDGTYAVLGLLAGTYDVRASKGDLAGEALNQVVTAGATTTVDIALQPTTGAIAGTVTQSDGVGGFLPVDAATVLVLPPGVTDPLQALATVATLPDGTYSAPGLPPGTYDVQASKDLLSGLAAGQVVAAGATTTVDIVVQ